MPGPPVDPIIKLVNVQYLTRTNRCEGTSKVHALNGTIPRLFSRSDRRTARSLKAFNLKGKHGSVYVS